MDFVLSDLEWKMLIRCEKLEREKGLEPSTFAMATRYTRS